jgi:DNA polymerase-3 subunit delta
MLIRADQLAGHLARGSLQRLYTVAGDDALLCRESLDALRAAARAQGFDERQVLHLDSRSDWSMLDAAAREMSLFSARRLVEVRLASGKPGKSGGEALRRLAAGGDADTLLLVVLPELEWSTLKTEWVKALQGAGGWVEVKTIERERLPAWIATRMARAELRTDPATLEFLADRFEGNLLAAQQEIEKLAILFPPGELAASAVRGAIFDVARYDLFDLPAAMLAGDGARALRLLAGLRAEGEPLPLILWAVGEELRGLLRVRSAMDSGRPFAAAVRGIRLNSPPGLAERVLARLPVARLGALLARCARIDRLAKGLRVRGANEDPWVELSRLALAVQGRRAA